MIDFEVIPHTADLKIRVYGTTYEQLFKNALIGMFTSIHPISSACSYKNNRLLCNELTQQHAIHVEAIDSESLLVAFLSEALYFSDTHNEAYLDIAFKTLNERLLIGTIYGVKIEGFEVVEIKAVTYHDLHIKKVNGIWQTDIVFDI